MIVNVSLRKAQERILIDHDIRNRKHELLLPLGDLLTELLNTNYDDINSWLNQQFFDKHVTLESFNNCETFAALSPIAQILIYNCTDMRFMQTRTSMKTRHPEYSQKTFDYFDDVKAIIRLIDDSNMSKVCRENYTEYLTFMFSHHLGIKTLEGLYENPYNLNMIHYYYPITLSYFRKIKQKDDSLKDIYEKAKIDERCAAEIIDLVPLGTDERTMLDLIQENYWSNTLQQYSHTKIRDIDHIAKVFNNNKELKTKFLTLTFDYVKNLKDHSLTFKRLSEYIAFVTLMCYSKGYAVKRCEASNCKKFFIRKTNSQCLCGSQQCASSRRKDNSLQRQELYGDDSIKIFREMYKKLCYSKSGENKSIKSPNAYSRELRIEGEKHPDEVSQIIVNWLQTTFIRTLKTLDDEYRKSIKNMGDFSHQDKAKTIYQHWLNTIKRIYNHKYIVNEYRKQLYTNIENHKILELELYKIDITNWDNIFSEKVVLFLSNTSTTKTDCQLNFSFT